MVDKNKIARTAGWISIFVNILLFGFKYWAGIASGSVAIMADAWHTLSDSITSVVVVVGLWIAVKPADKDHPFGHGRAEILAAVIVGVLLAVIGFEFLVESIQRLKAKEAADYGKLAIIVTAASVIIKEALAQYARIAGKKSGSKALKADSWHHRSDAISSLVILVGIFLNALAWWIDGVLGILVSLLIFNAAYEILRDTLSSLLGEKPDKKTVEKVMDICKLNLPNEVYPHHIHVHRYGSHTEMTLHIKLNKGLSLGEAHDMASHIEYAIRNELGIEATIHMEPLTARPGSSPSAS
ncbi:cation diffusion facilitator family transporter [Bacteroidota bacterium]